MKNIGRIIGNAFITVLCGFLIAQATEYYWDFNPFTSQLDIAGVVDETEKARYEEAYLNYSAGGTVGPPGYTPQLGVDYFDGRPGAPPLFCNLSGGMRGVTYDASGLNPVPAMTSFATQLWYGNERVTPLRYLWATGPAPRQISGSGTAATFTPSILAAYSANRSNNWINVQITYSSLPSRGGKRYCITGVPVAVTKIGPQGIQGEQGPPGTDATVTEPAVITAFNTTASNNPLVLQTTSGTQSKLEVWDTGSNTRMWFDTNGNQYFKDASGNTLVKVLTDGSVYLFKPGNISRVVILNDGSITTYRGDGTTAGFRVMTSGRVEQRDSANNLRTVLGVDGTVTTYRGNGTTPAFQLYTSGRFTWAEKALGNPGSDGYCLQSTTAGVRSWGVCGGGSDTQAQILAKIKTSADSMILERWKGPTESSTAVLFRIMNSAGTQALAAINAQGEIFQYRSNGAKTFSIYTGGKLVIGG